MSIPFLDGTKRARGDDDRGAFSSIGVFEATVAVERRSKADRNRREIALVLSKAVLDRSICVHSLSEEDRNRRVDVADRRRRARTRAKNSLYRNVTQAGGGRIVTTTTVKQVKRSLVSLELEKTTPKLIAQATALLSP